MDKHVKKQYLSDEAIMEIYKNDKNKGTEKMVEKYTEYVYHIIATNYPTYRTETADLYQNGTIGIMSAMKSYNPEKGAFTTYCTPYIKKELGNHIRFLSNESSEYYAAIHNHVKKAKNKLEAEGKNASIENIVAETGLSKKIVTRELKVDHTKVSVEALENLSAGEELENNFMIQDMLSCVPESTGRIIRMKILDEMSFSAIAEEVGKSIHIVRKEYMNGINTLRSQIAV